MTKKPIKLSTSDNAEFEVDIDLLKQSKTIQEMLENCQNSDDDETIHIQVKGKTFEVIVKWLDYHKDDPPPLESDKNREKRVDEMCLYDSEMLKRLDDHTLCDMIMAANYLGIDGLFEVGCQRVASFMIGKTTEQIRERLKIENDLTPEEEERIRQEFEWCEQK